MFASILKRVTPVDNSHPFPTMSLSVIGRSLGANSFTRGDIEEIEHRIGDRGFSQLDLSVTANQYRIDYVITGETERHSLKFVRNDYGDKAHATGQVMWNLFHMRFTKDRQYGNLTLNKVYGLYGHVHQQAVSGDDAQEMAQNASRYLEFQISMGRYQFTLSDGSFITLGQGR